MTTIGILGYGSIGQRHARNLAALGANIWSYDSAYDNLWKRKQVFEVSDAFVIATPTKQHSLDLGDCLQMKKPILIEKPITVNGAVNTAYPMVMVGYNLRFRHCVKLAKEYLPKIGTPLWARFVCAQKNEKPAYLRDGVILNWSHEIDLALYLLGRDIGNVQSVTTFKDQADNMTDIIIEQAGCLTSIHLDYVTEPEQRMFTIAGTDGLIEVDVFNNNLRMDVGGGSLKWFHRLGYDEDYVAEAKAFIDMINFKQSPIACTVAEANDVLEICLTVRKQAGLA